MLHRIKYLFSFLLFPLAIIYPQTIRNIEVIRIDHFVDGSFPVAEPVGLGKPPRSDGRSILISKNEVINWSGIFPGQKIYDGIIDSVKSRLALQFADIGYFHSDFDGTRIIDLPDSQFVDLLVSVRENEPTYINNIIFTNASAADSVNVIPKFNFLKGQIFTSRGIEGSISSALTYFENNGSPFSKIIISSINFFTDPSDKKYKADVTFRIDKGRKSSIDKIKLEGNTKTKDYVVLRELRLNKDEKYSQKLIDELPSRLNKLGFFEPVKVPDYYINSQDEGVLIVHLQEKQTNNFDGIIGYIPGSGTNTGGYFTGLVNISLRNLFGTGRAAAIRWQKLDQSSQELELKYLEPWVLGLPFNISGGLFQRKQDSTYVQRRLNIALQYLANEDISASLTLSTESVIPSDADTLFLTVYNSNSFSTGINFKLDTRDDPYSPTRGILFINSYSFSRKTINGPKKFFTPGLKTNVDLQRIEMEFKIFYQPFQRQVVALGLNGKELRGSFFELSDLFRLGGTNTLRGYRENQFLGSRVLWSNLEYRFLLTQRSFAFLFFDTGYFLRKEEPDYNIQKSEGFRIGYGLGINLETSLGVIGVSFALAKGDTFSEGKIHFGIVNEF